MNNKNFSIGDRMKEYYENRTRYFIPRRTYTIIRVDGKAFHTYTKGLKVPFDDGFIEDMDKTACYLCENIQGANFAFVQSDEISILLTDFENLQTDAWFSGNIQKMCSISASLTTAKFNKLRINRFHLIKGKPNIATFDSRVFTIPSYYEVENYFIWRQQDATRNSILSTALSLYSQKQIHGKNTNDLQEMCFQKNVNWNDLNDKYKRGRLIIKERYEKDESLRARWIIEIPPIFTQEREIFNNLIPKID